MLFPLRWYSDLVKVFVSGPVSKLLFRQTCMNGASEPNYGLESLCVIFSFYIMIEYCILFLCSTYYCITLYFII